MLGIFEIIPVFVCTGDDVVVMVTGMTTNGRHDTDTTTDRRVPVIEAAQILGLTPDAVRARLRRGTLERTTGEDGETLVVLSADTTVRSETGRPTEQTTVAYIDALKSHITSLERELDRKEEEGRRKDHLLAAALERIPPALESPPESPVSADDGDDEGHVRSDPEREQRSFWHRLFGV